MKWTFVDGPIQLNLLGNQMQFAYFAAPFVWGACEYDMILQNQVMAYFATPFNTYVQRR